MIRTLQATSIVAVVLAGVLFAMTEVRGAHNDENVDRFLNSPGVVERFKELKRNRAATAKDKTPPLVQQAERFKAYLEIFASAQRMPIVMMKVCIAKCVTQSDLPRFFGPGFMRVFPPYSPVPASVSVGE